MLDRRHKRKTGKNVRTRAFPAPCPNYAFYFHHFGPRDVQLPRVRHSRNTQPRETFTHPAQVDKRRYRDERCAVIILFLRYDTIVRPSPG